MGLGSLGLLLLAFAGIANEMVARVSGSLVFIPSLFLMVLPAALPFGKLGGFSPVGPAFASKSAVGFCSRW